MAQIIEERARELFLEGHRFADANRYGLPLYAAVGVPFPNGGTYGRPALLPAAGCRAQQQPEHSEL
jgi:hypothetical protein